MIPFRDSVRSRRFPVMTVAIIAANVACFGYELMLPQAAQSSLVQSFGVVPSRLRFTGEAAAALPGFGIALFTSMFLHGGFLHLLGNMWYLWIFGDNVEDRMGSGRFLLFYLLCGIAGGLAHVFMNIGSGVPTIGASGAVAGVLGAYLVSYPFARVLTLIPLFLVWPVVELPALLVLGAWFLVQLMSGAAAVGGPEQLGGVAWWAHIGGFVAGILLLAVFARPVQRRYYWDTE